MFRQSWKKIVVLCLSAQLIQPGEGGALPLSPVTYSVTTTSNDPLNTHSLPYALINAIGGDTIDCTPIAGQTITLTSSLPAAGGSSDPYSKTPLLIKGAGVTLDGSSNLYQAFSVTQGNVVIQNFTVQNTISKGGDGGVGLTGGGGGTGGGGALYVHKGATVTLNATPLLNNKAQGGDGGDGISTYLGSGGGGGGFGGGNGGSVVMSGTGSNSSGGGGGGNSNGGNGGDESSVGADGVYWGGGGGGGSTDDHPDTGIFNGGQFGGNGGYGAGGGGAWYGGFDFYALGGSGGSPGVGRPGGGGGGSGLGGGVFVQDGGTLIITDGVTLSGNTVQAGVGGTADGGTGDEGTDGSAYGQDIFLRSGAALVFNVEGTVTIPNPIDSEAASGYGYLPSQSPVGGVTKNGGGLVVLTGTNTYTGPTWVDGGNLKLNGSVLGDVNVDINGTFSGNAIVNGNLFSLGTISPGNSIGTIYTTNLNLESTNNYIVELNSSGASDEIIASGFAVVNGAVIATPLDLNFTAPETYTIVDTATGVSGVFTSLTSTVPALMTLTYDPLDVELTFLPLEPIGLTENAADAADCFVTIPSLPGTDASTVNAALMALSFDDIGIAFNQMSPAQFSGVSQAQLVNATLVRSTYTRHLDDIELNHSPCFWPETSVWVDAVGQYQNQNSSGQQFGYTDTTLGGTIGADYQTSNFVLGCAVSYTHDNFHWKDAAGNANVNSYYGGLYGRWNDEGFYVNVGVLGGQNKYKTTRHIHFGTIDRNADASHQGNQWLANIGVGYQVNSCDFNFQWTPYVNFDYVHLHERRYTECGAGILDLEINTKNASLFQGELGVLFTTTCCFCNGVFVPKLKLAYINQTPFYSKDYRASFEGSVCTFAGEGWNYERNLFAPSLALTYQNCCDSIDISLYYDAQLGNQYWTQGGGVQLEVKF